MPGRQVREGHREKTPTSPPLWMEQGTGQTEERRVSGAGKGSGGDHTLPSRPCWALGAAAPARPQQSFTHIVAGTREACANGLAVASGRAGDLRFPKSREAEHPCICLLVICMSSWETCLFRS